MWNWLQALLSRASNGAPHAQAHMTFGQTSLGRTVTRTGLLLKKQLWIWPIVAVVLLAAIGYAVSSSIQRTMETTLRSQLQTLLTVERAMLEQWLRDQEASAVTLANNPTIRRTVAEILAARADAADETPDSPRALPNDLQRRLGKEIEPGLSSHDFLGYVLADKRLRVVAATSRDVVGQIVPEYEAFLARALEGAPTVSPPFPSVSLVKDGQGRSRSGVPTMLVCAPIRDENLQVVAALALRIRPEKEFTSILQLGRIGESGETYAINRDGLMVSNSRFDQDLMLLGLLPDDEQAVSLLTIQIRDPGDNMLLGFRPKIRRREMPLTEIAEAAIDGTSGVMMHGHRDYRGVPCLGAWAWLPQYQLGLITEIDLEEAYRPLNILKRSFHVLYGLLGTSALAIFIFTLVVARLQRQARKAVIEAKQLGQYRLLEKIGAGAMGVVYKGHHAMLRRPTAIKMLDVDKTNDAAIARFEREVQFTCNLNNPHTVAIFDYGRTPEGVFYYAMEYLDGINLETLVERDGPQPEARVVHILRQVCASLYEAHSLGLVHRDVKPANIMLNRRGGEPDVVKVLDFGLVKPYNEKQETREVSGTPLYMSPEAIQTPELVDPRSDLYAVGAVGYFLLTGQTVFTATTLRELCQQQISAAPIPPSQCIDAPVSPELEHALLACLEKNRAKRPKTARDLAAMLDRAAAAWSLDEAEAWWSRYERGQFAPRARATVRAVEMTLPGAKKTSASAGLTTQQASAPTAGALEQTALFAPEDAPPQGE